RQRAERELEIHTAGRVRVHDNVLLRRLTESRELRLDGVAAWDEPRELVRPPFVRHPLLDAANRAVGTRERDAHTWQHGTGGILQRAPDCPKTLRARGA